MSADTRMRVHFAPGESLTYPSGYFTKSCITVIVWATWTISWVKAG